MRAIASLLAVSLAGCQTAQSYGEYASAMARIAEAKASVQREQAQALIMLAHGGDTTAKTVAVIMLGLGAGGGINGGQQYINPQPPVNEGLAWAQVLVPSLSTLAMGYFGYRLGVHQSDNSADVSIAGYGAMSNIAGAGFNAVGQFKPVPVDFSNFPVTTRTDITIGNRDGQVVIGGDGVQDNSTRPVVVVPPVFAPVPVVPVAP